MLPWAMLHSALEYLVAHPRITDMHTDFLQWADLHSSWSAFCQENADQAGFRSGWFQVVKCQLRQLTSSWTWQPYYPLLILQCKSYSRVYTALFNVLMTFSRPSSSPEAQFYKQQSRMFKNPSSVVLVRHLIWLIIQSWWEHTIGLSKVTPASG